MVWPGGHGVVYGMVLRAPHGIWYGLAGLAWYIVWFGGLRMVYSMAWRALHGISCGLTGIAWYSMAWRALHGIWYGLAGIIWLWPGRQGMGLGIVNSLAWRAWHGIWYGLAGKNWCMVWPVGTAWYMVWSVVHDIVYAMAWRASLWYGLADIAWYMFFFAGEVRMSWYVEKHSITCFKALPWAIVPFTRGVADVSWRSCSHVPDPFTSRGLLHACSVHTYSSCSLWTGIINREVVNL